MTYNIHEAAAAVEASRKMELKDVLDVAGALAFMMSAMAIAIALL